MIDDAKSLSQMGKFEEGWIKLEYANQFVAKKPLHIQPELYLNLEMARFDLLMIEEKTHESLYQYVRFAIIREFYKIYETPAHIKTIFSQGEGKNNVIVWDFLESDTFRHVLGLNNYTRTQIFTLKREVYSNLAKVNFKQMLPLITKYIDDGEYARTFECYRIFTTQILNKIEL